VRTSDGRHLHDRRSYPASRGSQAHHGHGNFIDDVNLVNMAHMSVVRSPHAHARIRSIDTSAAMASKGVVAVLTAADFKPVIGGPLPVTNSFVADKKQVPEQFPIAADEVAMPGAGCSGRR